MSQAKSSKSLNGYQKDILLALYKFRFITVDLLVEYQGFKSEVYSYVRLRKMVEQGYIGRHYTAQDKLSHKPAVYFLLPKGIRELRNDAALSTKALTNMYRDRQAGQPFIQSCLQIMRHYLKFRRLFGDALVFYSKSELSVYDFFPKPLPDAYLFIAEIPYFLEVIPPTTPYIGLRSKINRFIKHYESETWEETDMGYPTILLICDSPYMEKQLQRLAKRMLARDEIEDVTIYTTTSKALLNSENKEASVWSNIEEPDELVKL